MDLALRKTPPRMPLVTTFTRSEMRRFEDVQIEFVSTSLHCYTISGNLQDKA